MVFIDGSSLILNILGFVCVGNSNFDLLLVNYSSIIIFYVFIYGWILFNVLIIINNIIYYNSNFILIIIYKWLLILNYLI